MDEESGPVRSGGTVEPVKQAMTASGRPKLTTQDPPGREYELYDPFANVKHRAKTFDEMAAKADRAQALRFTAVDPDGSRTQVHKVDGQWQVPPPATPIPFPDRQTMIDLSRNLPAKRERAGPAAEPGAARTETVKANPVTPPGAAIAKDDAARERAAEVARIQASLHERYVIKRALLSVGDLQVGRTEYRFRGNSARVAFTESTFRLATDTNSPSVARSMVDVAAARNWKALRVSGHDDFRRQVWLEATVRGVKTLGYEPSLADLELLKREREARQVNRIEPARDGTEAAAPAEKSSARGGGRKAVLAAIEAVLVDRKVPEKQREAVMAAAEEKLAQRMREGRVPKVRVYDKEAPSQRPAVVPTPEMQRTRERAAPDRGR